MPRIRYKASRRGPYSGPTGAWMPGDEKDVADERQAAHLLGPLAEWFEPVEPPAPSPAAPNDFSPSVRTKPVRGRNKG